MSEPVVLQARNEPQQIVRAAGAIPTVVGQLGSIGPQGPAGVGVPAGGTTGQVLAKASVADYDDHWIDAAAGGSFQPLDADLTAIAALDSATAGALVTDGSGWIRKTYAQLKTALSLVKADVGLGLVDNTSDAAKPVSTAQQTALDLKANLASPALTGNPTAPTAAAADNDTSIATTAFVHGEVATEATARSTADALLAPLASPALTGNPTAPTASPGDNDTSLATTAFVTAAVAAGGGGGTAAYVRNRIINGNFRTNQRGYVSGTSTASGSYGFDRWKSGAAGSTMTFTAAPQGQTVTINSGGVWNQVIERANLESGTFTISWSGTATARAYKVGDTPPSYAASPITVTPDGTGDYTVEFTASGGTKTLGKVQVEAGSTATAFEVISVTDELLLCQRYYWRFAADATSTTPVIGLGMCDVPSPGRVNILVRLPVRMRALPSAAHSGFKLSDLTLADYTLTALSVFAAFSTVDQAVLRCSTASTLTAAATYALYAAGGSTSYVEFVAEL